MGVVEITLGTVAPATMEAAAAPPGWEFLPEKPGGGLIPMAFLGLMESTKLAGPKPDPQGLAHPTNGGNWGIRLDDTTKGTMGG